MADYDDDDDNMWNATGDDGLAEGVMCPSQCFLLIKNKII